MASSTVQYKFKSQTAVHTVQFDGPSIRVLDLKAEIIRTQGINKDMWAKSDLEISNAQTSEVFAPDSSVGRNVAVLVRRVPAQRRAPITSKIMERELSLDGDGRDEGSPPPGSAGGCFCPKLRSVFVSSFKGDPNGSRQAIRFILSELQVK